MEAGVGIEPAYTALQGEKALFRIKGLQRISSLNNDLQFLVISEDIPV